MATSPISEEKTTKASIIDEGALAEDEAEKTKDLTKAASKSTTHSGSLSSNTTTLMVTMVNGDSPDDTTDHHIVAVGSPETASQPIELIEPKEGNSQDFTNDAYMFRSLGKTLRRKIKHLGETVHYQSFFRSRHDLRAEGREEDGGNVSEDDVHEATPPLQLASAQEEQQQLIQFELSNVPIEQYSDMTRLVWSTLRIPFYALCRDQQGRHAVPFILSLIKVTLVDSSDDLLDNYSPNTSFTIDLQYGRYLKWRVNRRILDFVWLHSILSLRHLQGHITARLPSFPSQLSYLIVKRHAQPQRERMAHERRMALERYLATLLFTMNMEVSATELFEFLELSRLSLTVPPDGPECEWKGKEGYLKHRIAETTPPTSFLGRLFRLCWPRRGKWQTRWFLVRSSYIAYIEHLDEAAPSDVLLCDRHFRIVVANEGSSNPLKPFTLTITNGSKELQVRAESNSQMHWWLADLRRLAEGSVWCREHRFGSFAPVRHWARVEWLIDGEQFYTALVKEILAAKEEIYMHGWWISPDLYLQRPALAHPNLRLDRLLQRKAREGVRIFIVVFKELSVALAINSQHTKQSFEKLHPNIRVQRHPDHLSGVLLWAHHEKIIVVDQRVAFLGGLDLCYGRYDTPQHALTDTGPASIWNGMDYANPRIRDFRNVTQSHSPLVNRKHVPRMPWHDVHCVLYGAPARDTARHFIQRWNWVKQQKSMKKHMTIPFLLPKPDYPTGRQEEVVVTDSPERSTQTIQLLRSVGEWSLGTAPETSILDAYLAYIEAAEHFVLIENQFFISRSHDDQVTPVRNRIATAIIDRIMRAHEEEQVFRVFLFLPLLPAFESPVHRAEASSVRMIMQAQYSAISKGPHSILGGLAAKGIQADRYISFFALRCWDRLEGQPVTEQVYIHSKLMIVDDRVAILGSANINDRSMLGVRDSEIAVVVEDEQDLVWTTMNGRPARVGRKVQELRRRLFQEHLGLLHLPTTDPQVQILNDPIIDSFYYGVLRYQAGLNTQIYRELFHCVPDDCVDSWEEYRRFTEKPRVHVLDPDLGIDSTDNLRCIRGNIVLFPTLFLRKEDLVASMLTPEYLLPIEVYL